MQDFNLVEELGGVFDAHTLVKFWEFIDNNKWSSDTNCKGKLLKELSPVQAGKYKKILEYICDRLADKISTEFDYKNTFDIKAICSNIIGERGYIGLQNIIASPKIEVIDILSQEALLLPDIFLFMIPDEDDYWYN
jgi:hypothetical protein